VPRKPSGFFQRSRVLESPSCRDLPQLFHELGVDFRSSLVNELCALICRLGTRVRVPVKSKGTKKKV
jgi:hypothetical protein